MYGTSLLKYCFFDEIIIFCWLSSTSCILIIIPWSISISFSTVEFWNVSYGETDIWQTSIFSQRIDTLSREVIMRYNQMITKEKMLWSFIKLSQLVSDQGDVWISVWRICMWILGLEGLISTNTAVHTNKQALFWNCKFAKFCTFY